MSIASSGAVRAEASDLEVVSDLDVVEGTAFFVIERFGVENGYPSTITMQVRQVFSGQSAQVWKDYRGSEQDVFVADAERLHKAFADGKLLDMLELETWRRYEWRAAN